MGPRAARTLPIAIAWLLLTGGAARALPIVPIDSFESGAGAWTTVGDVRVVDSGYGVTPTDGSNQLLLTTNASLGAASTSAQESALGLNSNTIQRIFRQMVRNAGESSGSNVIEGSAIQITFTADAGDRLEFDWLMLTDEFTRVPADPDLFTDFVWMDLDPPSGSSIQDVPVHVNQGGFSSSGTGEFADETGYQTISFALPQTGTYTLTLGVEDVTDAGTTSGVVFDFFRRVVPEPDTFLLLGTGLLGLAWRGRTARGG